MIPYGRSKILRTVYDYLREANYRHELISRSHTVNGATIRSYEPLNAHRYVDEEELLGRLIKNVSDGEVVYDIGANVGTHSLVLSELYNIDIKCFEPNPEVYRWLEANVHANSYDRIDTYQLGLSDQDGVAELRLAHRQSSFEAKVQGHESAEIPVNQLDTLVNGGLSPPDRLKIDVEGHGPSVLEGARTTLHNHKPTVHIEPHSNNDEIQEFFQDINYTINQFQSHMIAQP